MESRAKQVASLNRHFDQVIEYVRDPQKQEREEQKFRENPLFSAGMRGLDRLKWDMLAPVDPALLDRLPDAA